MLLPPLANALKARFPIFAAVDDAVVTAALARAATRVDESWRVYDQTEGMLLYAAHQLTLDGQGAGFEAEANADGVAGLKIMRSGSMHIERFDRGDAQAGAYNTTSFGQRFQQLLKINRAGARVTGGGACVGPGVGPIGTFPWGY